MTRIGIVPRDAVALVWPQIEARLAKALGVFGLWNTDDACGYVESGVWDLWGVMDGASMRAFGLTEVVEFPRKRVLVVHASGGDSVADNNAMWPVVQDYARARGCARIIADMRRGWFRAGALPEGWKHVADVAAAEVV